MVKHVLFGLLLGLVLILAAWGTAAGSETETTQIDKDQTQFCSATAETESSQVVRVHFTSRDQIERIIVGREPWEVDLDNGYLVMEATWAEIERLEADGFIVEIDAKLTTELNRAATRLPGQTSGIPGYTCYRTVEETYASAAALAADHPELASWIDVGNSWEKEDPGGNDGYDLMVLKLTNANIPGPKPAIFVLSGIHAREYAPVELNMRFAEYLVDNYGVDADVTWLLDYHQIHLMFYANPDGRKHAEIYAERDWRKNTNNNFCGDTDNRGVDLNRNFSFSWYACGNESCSSSTECYETYRGPSGASEYETQAIEEYLLSLFPDQREPELTAAAPVTATGVFLDIHSYDQSVLWPWGFTYTPPPNATSTQTLGRKLAYFNNYTPEQASELGYLTDGATDDFAYGELGVAAISFEIGTSFFQSCSTFENTIYPRNLAALLYAARVARTPYMTPSGPDAVDLAAPIIVVPGDPLPLSATIDDIRYNNSNGTEPTYSIAAAKAYVDTPPWITATIQVSYSMQVSDGAWDEKTESVETTIDTTGLTAGRHIVYIQGQDVHGDWGPVSALFFDVADASQLGVISGKVTDLDTGDPLEAVVTAEIFQTTTGAGGLYTLNVLSDTYTLQADADGYAAVSIDDVQIQKGQHLEQDWLLTMVCGPELLNDDIESGAQEWQAESPWAISDEQAHSASHAWSDSPGGNYGDLADSSLTSLVFDLTNYHNVTLGFWHIYDIEPYDGGYENVRYDYGAVEVSTDGENWSEIEYYDGYDHTAWEYQQLPLPELDGQPFAQIRFHLHSDEGVNGDGWHIDDIVVNGIGPDCPAIPLAAFSSPGAVRMGMPITFTNLTTGAAECFWSFGDGESIWEMGDPSHIYTQAGNYTVTLIVTNSIGSDTASQNIDVYGWDTTVAGEKWTEGLAVTGQTSQTLVLVDTITSTNAITWVEQWDADRLLLKSYELASPIGRRQSADSTGTITWTIPSSDTPVTNELTRTFIILPCSWQATTSTISIQTDDGWSEERLVHVNKLLPVLELESYYQPVIEPNATVTLTLVFSNTGGFENDAVLQSDFPPGVFYMSALPVPDVIDPDGTAVSWNLGSLAMGQVGEIRVTAAISLSLEPGVKLDIPFVLYDHSGTEAARSTIQLYVPVIYWYNYLPVISKE